MKNLALGLVIGIAIGGIGMGVYSSHAGYEAKERELAGMAFTNHIASAGFATRVLQVMDEQRYDTARKLLSLERDSGIDGSYRLIASHRPQVGLFIANNLVPELDRTAAYIAETDADNHLLAWTHDVKDYMRRASVEP